MYLNHAYLNHASMAQSFNARAVASMTGSASTLVPQKGTTCIRGVG
jgi:hypothetical protein